MFPEQKGTAWFFQGDMTSITPSGLPRCVALSDGTRTQRALSVPGLIRGVGPPPAAPGAERGQ